MAAAASAKIAELVQTNDVAALVNYCEQLELELAHGEMTADVSMGVYKVHLASYLIMEQLDAARFLWKRLPEQARDAEPELRAIWAVGKAQWMREPATARAAMAAYQWSEPLIASLMRRMASEHEERWMTHASKSYSVVSPRCLVETIGVPVARVQEMAAAAGWTTDSELDAYVPKEVAEPESKLALHEQLKVLTDYVAHVEGA